MNLFDRLSEQHPKRSPSDIHAAIAEANECLAADYPELPSFECAAFMVIYAAMVLETSHHEKRTYRSAMQALLHPFYPGVTYEIA